VCVCVCVCVCEDAVFIVFCTVIILCTLHVFFNFYGVTYSTSYSHYNKLVDTWHVCVCVCARACLCVCVCEHIDAFVTCWHLP
jgi:hypothetical protein